MLAVAGAAAVVSVGVAFAANTAGFADPSSDSRSAADVTGVTISNDDAGIVTVKVALANRQVFGGTDDVAVALDVDQSPDTGSVYYGTEYELDLNRGTVEVWRDSPDGSYSPGIVPASLHITFSAGAVTFSFKASDFGIASGFNIYAISDDGSALDTAPDVRTVNYQLTAGASAPLLGRDRRAPLTRALKSAGIHGKVARLDYFAADGRGETADGVVVYHGKKVLKRFNFPIADTNPFLVYYASWKVPKKTRGKLRFCVSSTDRAGNKSKASCAALTIK